MQFCKIRFLQKICTTLHQPKRPLLHLSPRSTHRMGAGRFLHIPAGTHPTRTRRSLPFLYIAFNTIVDGHNRWKIILANPWLTYKVKQMDFSDKWEAFDWMYKNQLGRRNLTDEQKTFLLGKLYEARKHTTAGNQTSLRNADGTFQSDQNDRIGQRHETAEEIAEEQNVGTATVKRAEQYAHGIDAIRCNRLKISRRYIYTICRTTDALNAIYCK